MKTIDKWYQLNLEKDNLLAIQALTAYVAVGIFEIRDGIDYMVKVAGISGTERTAFQWRKLHADGNGAAYFILWGERYYLHDMPRTDSVWMHRQAR